MRAQVVVGVRLHATLMVAEYPARILVVGLCRAHRHRLHQALELYHRYLARQVILLVGAFVLVRLEVLGLQVLQDLYLLIPADRLLMLERELGLVTRLM